MLNPLRLLYILFMLAFHRARAFEHLGPTFIKFGQTLSTRPDLIGEKNAAILSELRDNVRPFASHIAIRIIQADLGADAFESIDPNPVAAASIAQVHRGKTKDGREVAIKILRPNVERRFKRDLDFMLWGARFLERFVPRARRLKPLEVVRTFKQTVAMELDLRFEAAAACELRENTKTDSGFYVPYIDWTLTSKRLLTLEWIHGIKLNDVESLKSAGYNLNQILEHISTSFFNQAFRDGFFHADMHPGNLFVNPKGELVVVDFGIMGRLDWSTRLYVAEIFQGFLNKDFMQVAKAHFRAGYVPAHQDVHAFALACRAIAMPVLDKPINEISIGSLLGQLFQVTETFEMETRPELLLFQKNLVVVEGIGRMLNPQINMWDMARGPIEQWAKEHLSLRGKIKFAKAYTEELVERAPTLIRKIDEWLQRTPKKL
jgi:ubiquinone biosynthesis protein